MSHWKKHFLRVVVVLVSVATFSIIAIAVHRSYTLTPREEFSQKYGGVVGDFYGAIIASPEPPNKTPAPIVESALLFLIKNRRPSFSLSLQDAQLSERSIDLISQMLWLNDLQLTGTNITDEDLCNIAHLTNLSSLALSGTAVSDAGLKHLRTLKNLERLYLGGTNVTADGLRQLAAELPNLDVSEELRLLED